MRKVRVVPLLLTVLLLLPMGCGIGSTADLIGVAAVSLDSNGKPILLVRVCHKDIDKISVFAGRKGLREDEPNPVVASWSTTDSASGTIRFPFNAPPSRWRSSAKNPSTVTFAADRMYIVDAGRSTEDAEVVEVSFRGAALRDVQPGHVLVGDAETWTTRRFELHACDHIGGQ